jgi:hypothetical protein
MCHRGILCGFAHSQEELQQPFSLPLACNLHDYEGKEAAIEA